MDRARWITFEGGSDLSGQLVNREGGERHGAASFPTPMVARLGFRRLSARLPRGVLPEKDVKNQSRLPGVLSGVDPVNVVGGAPGGC
jgi:hypothetical protein